MATFAEEKCFNVYWKIKNFSYCYEKIISPEFSIDGSGNPYCLQLHPGSVDVECRLVYLPKKFGCCVKREISFLTCDGSQEESISDGALRVPKDAIFGKGQSSFLPGDTLTVRLRHPTNYERGKLFICSQIGVKRKYFLWTIKNFSTYQGTTNKSVEKSELYGDIVLSLKVMEGFNAIEQLYIEILRKGGEKCSCILKVSVLGVDGKGLNEVNDEFVFDSKNGQQTRTFPAFFKKSKLLACKNLLLPEDTLSIKCNIALSLGTVTDKAADISYCENATSLLKEFDDLSMNFRERNESVSISELPVDLKSLLEDGTLFDVSLQIGTEVIPVHKSILSARSPVFKAMFTKDMKESIHNTVVIEDLDVEIVRKLVLYMYTDSIPDYQWENIKKLYSAADKYELLSLKTKCASLLKTNLSISDVCEALVFADLHQDGDLKTAALAFIFEHDSEVFDLEEWKELEKNNSSLVIQAMRDIYCNKRFRLN